MTRIHCELGDITRVEVDAIVNAANPALRGGGGVDGAIHRAAGPEMLAELIDRYPGGCPTGQARITHGYKLPTDWVVHTPGPIWHGGHQGEPELLASCHREALKLAAAHRCRTLAFPAISCGIFGYPLELAADVAVSTLQAECEHYQDIEDIRFVLFDERALVAFGARLGAG